MAYYGVIFPEFWTGRTGRELRARGGKDAQILALYLATNRHTNMLGLYRLLLEDVRHETGLTARAVTKAFEVVIAADFGRRDPDSDFVWVLQMARIRLGLRAGGALEAGDNRVLAVNRIYHALEPNAFLGPFFDATHKMLRLKKRRDGTPPRSAAGEVEGGERGGTLVDPGRGHHQMSGFEGASQGACKPDTEIRNRDQKQRSETETDTSAAGAAGSRPGTPRHENSRVIGALVMRIVETSPEPWSSIADLKAQAKDACARHRLAYDADVVGQAVEQALARRRRLA